ncbi:hypothetical protein LX32DRAFT_658388 [Colletotrichum zoysiae]|uniref:Ubiquitin-like domain-containing protein n=1 Tax=Colletotrichum zoysiae TaxID=1216348 RepID=A0AAD9LX74_9PEZI|nr:hypothetical protein LX32DRAFT_658388 [Colletotrichum zoysiae]
MVPSPDMAGIANLGCQLATKLVAYEMGRSYSGFNIVNLIEDILATAAALGELREFLASDASAPLPVYKRAGREAIEDLATRCGKVYTNIIRSAYRASFDAKVVQDIDFEALGPQDLKSSRLIAIKSNLKCDTVSDALDDCESQLRWLKSSLLLHLQVANIAHLQTRSRAPGSFDDELASRALAIRILAEKVRAAKTLVKTAERKERLALSDKSDTMSVASDAPSPNGGGSDNDDTASWKSGKTAKDSTAPSVCGDEKVEKTDVPPVLNPVAPPPHLAPTSFWHQPWDGAPDASPVEIKLPAPKHRFPVKVFKSMGKWVKGLFRRNATPNLNDLELEAAVLRNGPFPEPFLAFEPKMLRLELKRILKRRSVTSTDELVPQDSELRSAVSNALLRAKRKDGRARQLIAVDLKTQPDVAIVFMSVEPALEPVHVTDILGRNYDIPYELCRTVQGARTSIHRRFKDVDRLWPIVKDGAFEIVNEADTIITPEAWNATIKPGAVVKMRISAFTDGARPGMPQGCKQPPTWAEPWSAGPGWVRPPGMGIPPGLRPGCSPTIPRPGWGPPRPPVQPGVVIIEPSVAAKYELGFELDFGPPLTREEDLGENRRDLGAWVALWTYATDTDFTTNSGGVPSFDDASSISSGSTSSSSEYIID